MNETAKRHSQGSGQVFILFGASLLLVLTVGPALQAISFGIGLVITELALILLPTLLFVRWKRLPIAEALRWRPITPTVALLSLAVGVTAWGVAAGIHELSLPILGTPPDIEGFHAQTLLELLLLLLYGALLPGICEETLFRGAIQVVESDALAPEIQRGDRLVVFEASLVDLDLEVGDVITCRRGGKTVLRKITRIEGKRIWIADEPSEVELRRRDVTGKVVHKLKVGDDSR